MIRKVYNGNLIRNGIKRLFASAEPVAAQKKPEEVMIKKAYGNISDQDRVFTNLYRDEDPFLKGALKRVFNTKYKLREIGIAQRTFLHAHRISLLRKLRNPVFEGGAVLVFPLVLNTLLCLKRAMGGLHT